MPRLLVEQPAEVIAQPRATPNAFGAQVGAEQAYLGRQTQALGQVIGEYVESDARARAGAFEAALGAEAEAISLDPDIPGRMGKFEAAQKRIKSQFAPKMGGQSTYDSKTSLAAMDLGSRFQHKTMVDGIAEMRRNTKLEVERYALQAASAESDEEAGTYFLQAREAIDSAANYYTPAERELALRDAIGTSVRAMADTNPKMALRTIDRLGTMLPAEVTAVYRAQAQTNIRQAAADEVAAADRARKLGLQAEADASRAAEQRLLDLERDGNLTLEAVRGEPGLSPAAYRRMKSLATGGGKGSASDPEVYNELSDRAYAGEDVVDEANAALERGSIGRPERDSIVESSRNQRFKVNRDGLKNSLDPGNFAGDARTMRAKQTRALQSFDRWARDNPDATFEEAEEKANSIVDAAIAKIPKPRFMGITVKTTEDVQAMTARILDQEAQGIITSDQAEESFKALQAISREIEARATRPGGAE